MIEWNKVMETEDHPKMIEVYLEQAWQSAFCFGLAVEEQGENRPPLVLMTIIAGSDSSLQAIKAAIDMGSHGMYFGHGIKETFSYRFEREFSFFSEKGKYEKFPITVNNNRKALIIVHDKLMNNEEYVLSFDGNPKEEIRRFLGGGKYGLHILPEWTDVIYDELVRRGHIEEINCYIDRSVFSDGFSLLRVKLEEEEADTLVSELLKRGIIRFPVEGTGEALEEIYDLPTYMQTYVNDLIEKMADTVKPLHNPLEDESFSGFSDYKRQLFPVQAHVATAAAKKLQKQKAIIINGEMSTGKTTMMVAATDAFYRQKGKKGYFACVMVPPSLTKKWPEEIKEIIPHADVHVIERTEELIRFHNKWTEAGRPKPTKPTFFVISFTTMRGDAVIRPAVEFIYKKTQKQRQEKTLPYRYGFYCPSCGKPHQVIENKRIEINEEGEEVVVYTTRAMNEDEFGDSRRLNNAKKPANAFCFHCGDSLWTRDVPTRYSSFKEWVKFERELTAAIRDKNKRLLQHILSSQQDIPKQSGRPRRIAAIEYIRRRMKNFFDVAIVDEVHELKGGMTAQGNALGSLAAASKKVIAGSGTLFGGRSDDVYYLMWRLFPHVMVENGYKYSDVRLWNEHYGNIEKTYVERDTREYSNKSSRGGKEVKEKVLPGISPFVFGKFLIQNTILVRLVDVWPDPVELVDVPTILVDMDEDLRVLYQEMVSTFEKEIEEREDGFKLYLPLTETGISLPDNPFTYPEVTFTTDGVEEVIYSPRHLSEDRILPKEAKLQEIIKGEIAEGRASIVYVRDTGSSREGRDVRPRLKKVLENVGAKVAILDASTTKPNRRSEWLKQKVEKEGYNVIIVSQELVKVGLDLLCTPTLIFYQFSWSLFTINQAARRAWRIGQTKECRLFYLAYRDTYQEYMAQLIAMKNKASAAMSGEVSSEGLSAMLGDEGDLQSLLIKAIKEGTVVKGSTEEWTAAMSDRAREILAGIGKAKQPTVLEQFETWVQKNIQTPATQNVLLRKAKTIVSNIESGKLAGFTVKDGVLHIDLIEAFGFDMVDDGAILSYLVAPEVKAQRDEIYAAKIVVTKNEGTKRKRNVPADGQLAFDLFAM